MNIKSGSIEEAIQKAREHFQGVAKKPYYNEKGFIAHPPPVQQGEEITSPRHNPHDLVAEAESWMDNDDYRL